MTTLLVIVLHSFARQFRWSRENSAGIGEISLGSEEPVEVGRNLSETEGRDENPAEPDSPSAGLDGKGMTNHRNGPYVKKLNLI